MKDNNFQIFAGVRTTRLVLNNNPVDISNADSGGFREMAAEAGLQSMQVSLDGIVSNGAVFRRVRRFAAVKKVVTIQYRSFTNEAWQSDMVISSLQLTGAYNDVETFSITLDSTGPIQIKIDANLYQRKPDADGISVDETDLEAFVPEDEVGT
jgi:predicted secreted protein